MKKNWLIIFTVVSMLILGACSAESDNTTAAEQSNQIAETISVHEETMSNSENIAENSTVPVAETVLQTTSAEYESEILKTTTAAETVQTQIETKTESEDVTDKNSGMSQPVEDLEPEQNKASDLDIITPSDIELDKAFTAYKRLNFFYGEFMDCYVEVYTQAEVDKNGEVWWDDSNAIAAIAVMGESSFLLFPEEYVQLGEPKFSVFESEDGVLHILMEDKRSAQYYLYDFVYDAENRCFEKQMLVDFPGCNFWGTI